MPQRARSKSSRLFARAQRVLPGGVDSPVRAYGAVGGEPPFIQSARGARVKDVDGRSYIDFVMSWGPLIHGHAPAELTRALAKAARTGTSFGAPTAIEVELGQRVCRLVPSVERVRFVNSGTEATMSAVRVARAATRRDKVIKFAGCYHGHADAFLVEAGSGATTLGIPTSPGVTRATAADTLIAQYNDINSVKRLCRAHARGIAAVIVEPIAGNMGVVLPADGFLNDLRAVCDRHGLILIFDEVISGFRVGAGGAQARYRVLPDLTCLGKIIGGGLPVGAYGGRADLMDQVAPAGPVYQAGTLSGNPLAMTAGKWALARLSGSLYRRARQAGRAFRGRPTRRGTTGRRAAAGERSRLDAHTVLYRPEGHKLRLRYLREFRRVRDLLPKHASPRDLPTSLAVRSMVPVGGAHRAGHRPGTPGNSRGPPSGTCVPPDTLNAFDMMRS